MIYMSLHDVELGSVPSGTISRISPSSPSDSRYLNGWVLLFQYSAMCLALQIGIGVFLAVALNGSRFEKILVTTLPDADDDGAHRRRPGLVLPLQRHLRLVPLAAAERRHPRREIHPRQPRHGDARPSSSSTSGNGRRSSR